MLARLVAVELAEPAHQGLGLTRCHPALPHELGRLSLISARQRGNRDGRTRGQQPEPQVGLHCFVESFGQQQPATDPALVAA